LLLLLDEILLPVVYGFGISATIGFLFLSSSYFFERLIISSIFGFDGVLTKVYLFYPILLTDSFDNIGVLIEPNRPVT